MQPDDSFSSDVNIDSLTPEIVKGILLYMSSLTPLSDQHRTCPYSMKQACDENE